MKEIENFESLSNLELENINGGSTCPTYDNSDNYDAGEATGGFIYGFICGLLGI